MELISIRSTKHEELIDITQQVQTLLSGKKISSGLCCIYTPHTTAAITINENADPSVAKDILKGFAHFDFEKICFSHGEGNSPSHLKSSLIGCSETVCIENGSLMLGTWQGIFFCEFDGPRLRKVYVQIV